MNEDQAESYLLNFQSRVLQDAITEATAATWERRADAMEWAKPKPGDFHGEATREELNTAWRRLDADATACRQRAVLAREYGLTASAVA